MLGFARSANFKGNRKCFSMIGCGCAPQRANSASASRATKRYDEMSARIVGTVNAVTARGQAARDEVADVVVRGARSVEQFAAASKSDSKRA